MTVGCVNPALPGCARVGEARQLLVHALDACPCPAARSTGRPRAALRRPTSAPRAWCPGAASTTARSGYLSIRTNHSAGDKWTDHIGGEVAVFGMFLPAWGMHLSDIAEAQGDLIARGGERRRYSIQNSCSTLSPSAFASLMRERRRRGEHTVFNRVDGLARSRRPARQARPASGQVRSVVPSTDWPAARPCRQSGR